MDKALDKASEAFVYRSGVSSVVDDVFVGVALLVAVKREFLLVVESVLVTDARCWHFGGCTRRATAIRIPCVCDTGVCTHVCLSVGWPCRY